MDVYDQIIVIFAGVNGYLDDIQPADVKRFEEEFLAFVKEKKGDLRDKLTKEAGLGDELKSELVGVIEEFKKTFIKKG